MRFIIALMKHETNTFSPVPTPLESFGNRGPYFGQDAFEAFRGTNTPMSAFIDLAVKEEAEIVTPVAAEAWPSGPVHRDAYQCITDTICEAVQEGCDALFLDLHGAMVTETNDDGEGVLLERIRRISPGVPIAVTLDMHANVTQTMVENCSVITGYKTYPHVDMYAAGAKAGDILIRSLKGKVKPAMVWDNRPMLPHTLRMGTDKLPMQHLVALANQAEADDALAAAVFGGFPLADIHDAGLSTVVVTDENQTRAEKICRHILDTAWEMRRDFIYDAEPLAESVAHAKQLTEGPVLLIDHADNCASGGTQDTMAVVKEVMRQGLENVAVGAIRDPEAVDQLIQAGVGNRVTIALGGKMDMPSIGLIGEPLQVTGIIRAISDGQFIPQGPMYTGVEQNMGRTVVLDTGGIQIVIIERGHEPFDLGIFRSVGIEPTTKRYVLLKSRLHYRAGFLPIAKHIVECNGIGVTGSDYSQFRFQKVRRPIYPLDVETDS
ncbi:MAG: M81 family metallopeptidase [Desulfobacterales bacterium]|nr:M81 family metallopeptidase [Desulfobacterales bacterium]MBL7172633.1 M81 family metallopeptidase [Desulfobacteraceae bacterium]